MNSKTNRIIYYIVTALFSLMMVAGGINFFMNFDEAAKTFNSLGYPSELVYPLGAAKILGVVPLWIRKFPIMTQLAYAGFAIELILAIIGHASAGDGMFFAPVMPLILLAASYFTGRKLA